MNRTVKCLLPVLCMAVGLLLTVVCAVMVWSFQQKLQRPVRTIPNTQIYETIPQEETVESTETTEKIDTTKPVEFLWIEATDMMYLHDETEQIVEDLPEEEDVIEIVHDQEFIDRCRLTFAESGGECLEGQIAVAATVLNREESESFPDTFYGVMNQSSQFSPVWNAEVHVLRSNGYVVLKYEDVSEKTIEAVERALKGEDPTERLLWEEAVRLGLDPVKYAEGGALFFYNPDGCSEEELAARENIKVKIRIGNHIFYKVWG